MNVKIFFRDDSGKSQELISEIFQKENLPQNVTLHIIHDAYNEPLFHGMNVPSHGLLSALLSSRDENNWIIFVSDICESDFSQKHYEQFSQLSRLKNVVFFQTPISIFGIVEKYNELLEKNSN